MGVRNMLGATDRRQKGSQNGPMSFGWGWNPRHREIKPFVYLGPCLFDRERTSKNPRICREAHKSEKAGPRKANTRSPIERILQPMPCGLMLWKVLDPSIDQEVGIYDDQRKPGPSAKLRASEISFRSGSRHPPSEVDMIR